MNHINRFLKSFFIIMLALSFYSCNSDKDTTPTTDKQAVKDEITRQQQGDIHLTREQINAMDISMENLSEVKINDYIQASGYLGLPPNAYSSVSARASGFIKNSNKYLEGSFVKKGAVLASLENPQFIRQQQEYLEVSAELTFLKQELERQQTLINADAGVIKNVQELQSKVAMKTATQKGLAKQLAYLGIKVASLTADNIVQEVAITAPMTGYITSIFMHNGMYVKPEIALMEIVTDNHLHLELEVFEKDIALLKEGQEISYTVPALGTTVYEGEVHIIGKEFNAQNKTILIHGHLKKDRPRFIKDLFIEAKIWLNDQVVQAVPEGAILKDGGISYIFVSNNIDEGDEVLFRQLAVVPGATEKGYTSIKLIDSIPAGMKVVTQGAYYVYAQSKKDGGGHE